MPYEYEVIKFRIKIFQLNMIKYIKTYNFIIFVLWLDNYIKKSIIIIPINYDYFYLTNKIKYNNELTNDNINKNITILIYDEIFNH